jgi:hypothetical protein
MANPRNLDEIATEAWSFSLDQGIINSASWSPNGTLLVLNCFPRSADPGTRAPCDFGSIGLPAFRDCVGHVIIYAGFRGRALIFG